MLVRWVRDGDRKKVARAAGALRRLPRATEAIPAVRKRLDAQETDEARKLDDRTRRSLQDLLKRLEKAQQAETGNRG